MNFSTPEAVGSVIETAKKAELIRAQNRVLINELFNGHPPYSEEEAEENGIHVNVNWKEGTNYAWNARRQYENAFLKPSRFFTVKVNSGKAAKRPEYGRIITENINRVLKRDRAYFHLVRSKFAGVVLHGSGAQLWSDKHSWRPQFVAVEDLLIPTDVECSFRNLVYFAIRREYTSGELARKVISKNVDARWNRKAILKILDELKDDQFNKEIYTWSDSPEKMAELYKQNQAYYESDKAPTVVLWEFYHQEPDGETPGFHMKVVRDRGGPESVGGQFLYDSGDKPFAANLDHILHVQYGDGNNKPPFLYHSVRSLGFLLYDVCQLSNRLHCQMTQHVFEQLMMLFRIDDPSDRDRVKKILLANNQVIEAGINIIPREQRHQVDTGSVQLLMARYKQLMGESTSSYTQQPDTGTSKEQTATETMAKVEQLNALMGSMLATAYMQETFAYEEICRRFTLEGSTDKDVERFQTRCKAEGIPSDVMDSSKWDVEPEQVLGGGNKMMEIAQAQQLMAWRNLYGPEAQQLILHSATGAVTNQNLATALVPLEQSPKVTDAVHDAELSFGTLMQGLPVSIKDGFSQIEQIDTLLRLTSMVIGRIMQTGGVGTQQDVIGLRTVESSIGERINLLAQDPNERQRVRSYAQDLGKMMNEVKGFEQRQMQMAQEQQQQPDPETIQKLQSAAATTQQKLAAKEQSHQQKLQQKNVDFVATQMRENEKTKAEIARQHALTAAEVYSKGVTSAADAALSSGSEE